MIKAYAHRFLASLGMTGSVNPGIVSGVRICVLAALLAFAISCGKAEDPVVPGGPDTEEDPWAPLCGDVPIRFSTCVAETRTTTPLPTTTNFRVFAFYQPGVIGVSDGEWNPLTCTPNFMYDEEVSYNDSRGMWTYDPVKYWPNNAENTLTFWAYSPYYDSDLVLRKAGGSSTELYGNTVPGIPDVQFTTDASRDLLISELAQNLSYRGGDPATVSLLFHHVMCWVDFTVTKVDPSNDYDMYLKSISIEDLFFTAVFSQNSDFSEARWLTPSGATGDISVFSTDAVPGVELSHSVALDYPPKNGSGIPERQIIPLPQRLVSTAANTPVLHVVYSYKLKSDSGEPATYESFYPLSRIHTRWDKEKHYTYNIHISPGVPLLFTATVARWDNEQNGYFNVNN